MELCTDVQITPLLPLAFVQSSNMAVTVSPAVLVTDLGEGGRAMTLPIEEADGVQWVTITGKNRIRIVFRWSAHWFAVHRRVQH